MSEMLEKLKAFLDTEEGKQSIKDYFLEIDEKEKKEISYFNSEEYNQILDTIRKWMFECSLFFIKDEDFNYGLKLPISEDEYFCIINSTLRALYDYEEVDETCPFGNGFVYYNEWKISYMVGQGTVHKLELCLDRFKQIQRNEKLSILGF